MAEANVRQAQRNNAEGKKNAHDRTQERLQAKKMKKAAAGRGAGGKNNKHITIEMSSAKSGRGKKIDEEEEETSETSETSDEEGYDRRRLSKTTVI